MMYGSSPCSICVAATIPLFPQLVEAWYQSIASSPSPPRLNVQEYTDDKCIQRAPNGEAAVGLINMKSSPTMQVMAFWDETGCRKFEPVRYMLMIHWYNQEDNVGMQMVNLDKLPGLEHGWSSFRRIDPESGVWIDPQNHHGTQYLPGPGQQKTPLALYWEKQIQKVPPGAIRYKISNRPPPDDPISPGTYITVEDVVEVINLPEEQEKLLRKDEPSEKEMKSTFQYLRNAMYEMLRRFQDPAEGEPPARIGEGGSRDAAGGSGVINSEYLRPDLFSSRNLGETAGLNRGGSGGGGGWGGGKEWELYPEANQYGLYNPASRSGSNNMMEGYPPPTLQLHEYKSEFSDHITGMGIGNAEKEPATNSDLSNTLKDELIMAFNHMDKVLEGERRTKIEEDRPSERYREPEGEKAEELPLDAFPDSIDAIKSPNEMPQIQGLMRSPNGISIESPAGNKMEISANMDPYFDQVLKPPSSNEGSDKGFPTKKQLLWEEAFWDEDPISEDFDLEEVVFGDDYGLAEIISGADAAAGTSRNKNPDAGTAGET